jgi:HEAT repeat protein
MVINTSGLFVQIFFSGYLIRRIGIARGLCALPFTVLAGFVLIATRFAFWPGVALRYTWDMIGMTVQGNSYQLAMNAVPAALRARIRGFIEGVVNPLGGILGGILILTLHHLFDSTGDRGWSDPVTLAGLALAAAWLIVVSRSGKIYLNTVSENLRSPEKRTAMDAIDCLEEHGNARAEELLNEVANMPDPEKRAAAARVRGAIRSPASLRALAGSCADQSPQVRREAIRALSQVPRVLPLPVEALDAAAALIESDPDPAVRAEALNLLILREASASAGDLASRWLKHGSPDVRVRIVEALSTLGNDKHALLAQGLLDSAPAVRAAAVCALWNDGRWHRQAESALAALAAEADPSAHAPTLAACHRTGSCPEQSLPMRLLCSPDPVARVLAGAAVLRFHAEPAAREQALAAIFETLGDESHSGILRTNVLPLVPDLGEEASDTILLAAAKLPPDTKSRVSKVLGEWYRVLDARIGTLEL